MNYTILEFDWDDPKALKENLKMWAYNDGYLLLEQDEELLFQGIADEWIEIVFPFVFDENCVKREYILKIIMENMQVFFLYRDENEINRVHDLFIKEMQDAYQKTNDKLIGDFITIFFSNKELLYK